MIGKCSLLVAVLLQVIVSYHTCWANIKIGACPQSPLIPDFNIAKYTGKWYGLYNFPVYFLDGLKCENAQYGLINNSSVTVTNTGIYKYSNKVTIVNGTAFIKKASEPNRLMVTFPIKVFDYRLFNNSGNYDVWATDYVNYSLVYSCTDYDFLFFSVRYEIAYILSRTKSLPDSTLNMLYQMLTDRGVDTNIFVQAEQSCDN